MRGYPFVKKCPGKPASTSGFFAEVNQCVEAGIELSYEEDGESKKETFNVVVAFVPDMSCLHKTLNMAFKSDALGDGFCLKRKNQYGCGECPEDLRTMNYTTEQGRLAEENHREQMESYDKVKNVSHVCTYIHVVVVLNALVFNRYAKK